MSTNQFPKTWHTCFFGLAVVVVSGCGPTLIKPHGRIVKNGAPLELKKGEMLLVTFMPMFERDDGLADPAPASTMPQETNFHVKGRKGKGIAPGKYRIAVELVKGTSETDLWAGKWGRKTSAIVRDLSSDKDDLIIDLAKP